VIDPKTAPRRKREGSVADEGADTD
jgi:hypothetical protein